jgi:opacity protein-like surface antigen
VNSGFNNLFGLDQANMRFGFDYGISNRFTIGFGRSNVGKEWDGFIKFRPLWQSAGPHSSPISIVLVTGTTVSSLPWADPSRKNYFTSRMAFYHEVILGRKFNERFSFQLSPVFVHRNLVALATDANDVYALGAGMRFKLSKRVALVADYHYIIQGLDKEIYKDPLSVGFDIETGGHVFQLHFSNAVGMNEKSFITNTINSWSKGEVRFGFNLSRVFTISKSKG